MGYEVIYEVWRLKPEAGQDSLGYQQIYSIKLDIFRALIFKKRRIYLWIRLLMA